LLPQLGVLHISDAGRAWQKLGENESAQIWFYVACFAGIYVLTAVAVFFNVALIRCALACHAGEEPSVRAGLAAAMTCLPQILGWALVATTVGVALMRSKACSRTSSGSWAA